MPLNRNSENTLIKIIKKIFDKDKEGGPSNNEVSLYRIHLATCALLLELANVDGEFSDEERENIILNFKTNYRLNEKDIDENKDLNDILKKVFDLDDLNPKSKLQ